MAVEREVFDWGVRLTARPFSGANAALVIKSEIAVYKPGKGSEVRITFTGTSMVSPLRLLDAQAWLRPRQMLSIGLALVGVLVLTVSVGKVPWVALPGLDLCPLRPDAQAHARGWSHEPHRGDPRPSLSPATRLRCLLLAMNPRWLA